MQPSSHDNADSHTHLSQLSRMCRLSVIDRSNISALTQFINEHEKSMNSTIYLEQLLQVIEGPEIINEFEEFSKSIYRIVTRTNFDDEPQLSFRSAVNLQLLLLLAEQKEWSLTHSLAVHPEKRTPVGATDSR